MTSVHLYLRIYILLLFLEHADAAGDRETIKTFATFVAEGRKQSELKRLMVEEIVVEYNIDCPCCYSQFKTFPKPRLNKAGECNK